MNKIELLSPAGSLESFKAAISAGANAVYMGGKMFSARAYASNFSNEEIGDLIKYAHSRGVKVYITVNTLIFEDEFIEAVKFIDYLYKNDVDGVLLQDLGLAYYLHTRYPDLILHASTQLNCHNISEAKALINLGFKRLVLAREVSLEEAKKIKDLGVEIEVFVHGALCVSYSGQCLMSSFIGNRSGNRGRCAQPCRNEMKVIGNDKESHSFGISTKDMCSIEYINKLIDIGIDSLKIEGRMKKEEYVYQVVSSYKKAIDSYYENKKIDYEEEILKMKSLFNRDFTKGYLFNESRTSLLNQKTSSHQGTLLGRVIKVRGNYIDIKLVDDLYILDGIRFNNKYQSGQQVQKMFISSKEVKEGKKNQIVTIIGHNVRAFINDEVIKTTSKKIEEDIRTLMKIERKNDIDIKLSLFINKPMEMELVYQNKKVKVFSSFIVSEALNNPTTRERIIEQVSKLGDTPFKLNKIEIEMDDDIFVSIKELNALRREGIDKLINKISNLNSYDLSNIYPYNNKSSSKNESFSLMCQIENKVQLEIALKYPFKKILVNNPKLFDEYKDDPRIYHSLSRINHFDDTSTSFKEVLPYIKEIGSKENLLTSPYFNLVNSYSLDLIYNLGIKNVICSYELSKDTILKMMEEYKLRNGNYPNLSLPLYGKVDLMIMKSCPISNMYGISKDHCNLCKKNNFYLKDRLNLHFDMIQDENCTTRILNSHTLYLLDKIDEIKKMNISNGILYFTNEDNLQVNKICKDAFDKLENENTNIPLESITRGHFLKKID